MGLRCGHCKQLAPHWSKAAASLKGVVRVGAFNCEDNKDVCTVQGVKGYPTIKAFVPGGSTRQFNGDRSAKAIADWALSLVSSRVLQIRDEQSLQKFLAQCGGGKGKDHAAWGLCVILLSNKAETPALYKALSMAYAGKVAFGEVQSAGKAGSGPARLAAQLGLSLPEEAGRLPLLLSVCNGDITTIERFSGQLKSDALLRHLEEYTGGKKCARTVRLDASTDLSSWTASRLKELVKEKGLDCRGCAEKDDFVRRLRDYVTKGG